MMVADTAERDAPRSCVVRSVCAALLAQPDASHTHDEHEKSRNKNLNKPVTLHTSSITAEDERRKEDGGCEGEEKERRK